MLATAFFVAALTAYPVSLKDPPAQPRIAESRRFMPNPDRRPHVFVKDPGAGMRLLPVPWSTLRKLDLSSGEIVTPSVAREIAREIRPGIYPEDILDKLEKLDQEDLRK